MNDLIVFSGIDYAGKTYLIDELAKEKEFTTIENKLSPELKQKANSSTPEIRYQIYFQNNIDNYNKIIDALENSDVIMDRYWPDTLATHNALMNTNLEETPMVKLNIGSKFLVPDMIIMPWTDTFTINLRQIIRAPGHKYETNLKKLMKDQLIYFSLMHKLEQKYKMNIKYVDNRANFEEKALEYVKQITDFLPIKL